ncbi:hypothetical protein [Acidovorax sp.]|uniref:hypothetical protein n=1 Tax=Acidovorax sp. TaxID=1872122 RepID=UPI003D04CBB3
MIVDDYGNLVPPSAVRGISQRLDDGDARMTRIEADLANNTKATQENTKATQEVSKNTSDLVELIQAFKGMFRVLDWLGRMAKPIASILALGSAGLALWAAWKGHK